MSIFDMPNYLWITIIAMVILTVICTLILHKWFCFNCNVCCTCNSGIFIPNFYSISYQPLLGYAAFLAIMSLILSFLLWYSTRNWRRERKKNN